MKTMTTTRKTGRARPRTGGGLLFALLTALALFGLTACDQAYMMPGDEGFESDPGVESVEFGLRGDEIPEEGEEDELYGAPVPTGGSGFVIDYTRGERKAPGDPAALRHPDPKPWHSKGP